LDALLFDVSLEGVVRSVLDEGRHDVIGAGDHRNNLVSNVIQTLILHHVFTSPRASDDRTRTPVGAVWAGSVTEVRLLAGEQKSNEVGTEN
jgi:hypothetical protein